jgi:hypothetical protein
MMFANDDHARSHKTAQVIPQQAMTLNAICGLRATIRGGSIYQPRTPPNLYYLPKSRFSCFKSTERL